MSYCISQIHKKSKFYIKAELKSKALNAIKTLVGKGGNRNDSEIHFDWVNDTFYKNVESLEEALLAWRWSTKIDNIGNIIEICFEGEKYGNDYILFQKIAPFVENDSVIRMIGEDGGIFEWQFINGICREKTFHD